ncbi:TPA: isochorismatase family protein [Klebsiella pneumoniae]|nr:isochorismatase family protein [Klebsiella pneumoniae]HDU8110251.1 isochorismatase family protein [Klebsiella pneumoniae]
MCKTACSPRRVWRASAASRKLIVWCARRTRLFSFSMMKQGEAGSEGFALLPELEQPAGALYVTKTACDAFYHTSLAQVLDEHDIQQFVICGCATDYCLDTTIKNGASRGYVIVIAEDAHTTADRPAAQAATLIAHYNEVWRTLTIPGNPLQVKPTETILHAWQQN